MWCNSVIIWSQQNTCLPNQAVPEKAYLLLDFTSMKFTKMNYWYAVLVCLIFLQQFR